MTQIITTNSGGGGGGGSGEGDMKKSVYDPNNVNANAFDYDNFINTPTIPAAQVQSDWDEADNTQVDYIKNKPTIPTVNNSTIEIQKNGTKVKDFKLNQSSGETINITVPTDTSDLTNDAGYITGIDSEDVTTALGYTPVNPSSLGTAASKNTGTSSGNVPVLDTNGKLATTVLPGLALTDTFTVTNKSDLTSLSTAQQGDIGIVTSESKTYVLSTDPYSTAANWKELLSPTDTVTSVNSQTGAVTLDADDISDSTTTNKFVTATDKTTWSGKQDALTLPATPTQGNLVTWGADNKTFVDGGAIPTGVPSGGTDGQVLSKVSGSVAWANPSGGITNDTTGTTTTITKMWAGTSTEYNNLGTISPSTIYYVF